MAEENLDFLGIVSMNEPVNKKLQEEVFKSMRDIDGITEWLKDTMSQDIKRYFNATTPLEQALAKGAYFRMNFMLNVLTQAENKKKEVKKSSSGIARYAP